MVRHKDSTPRGFTLVELMVASAISLILLTVAMGLLHQFALLRRRQEAQEQMNRTAAQVLGQLATELRQAGLGRPRATRADGGGEPFPSTFLLADATQVAFLADLPRPDSSFNGFSSLASDQGFPGLDGLALLNELNGDCDVDTTGVPCTTDASSLLFPPTPGVDCGASANAPTCPWGLGRYRANEYLLVVAGTGRWVERRIHASRDMTVGNRRALQLTTPLPAGLLVSAQRGFVSTPDRVFYRLNAGALERNQCWGSIGGPVTTAALATPCAAGPDGTGWEPLVTGLPAGAIAFTYLDAASNVLATPVAAASLPTVHRVRAQLQLQQAVGATLLTHAASTTLTPRP